ncbi:hypothetical protein Tco_0933510 [Tanacetum coccineum]
MPSRPDLSFAGLDDSVYKTKVSETITTASKTSKDSLEKPKTVRPSAPIIEDWDTNSDNDSVFRPKTNQTKPKFTKINFVKSNENVKSVNKENTRKQVEYPRKSQSPRVVTKSGQVPVNTAKQSSPRAATSISIARLVNTTVPKPKVNDALPTTYYYFKAHSPIRRAFNQKSCDNHDLSRISTMIHVAFATGCKRIKNSRQGNRKIRIPIAMWPGRVEEKMTLKEVDGQTIEEIETKIIAKDGIITRVPGKFQGYETFEEEPVEQPRRHDLYGFVDHPQLQKGNLMNEFAPHRLP